MDVDMFRSELGEIAVTKTHVERQVNDSENWERINEKFSGEKLVESATFDEVTSLELEKGSVFPNIRLKIDGEWRRLFMHVGDEVDECFRRLNYRWRAYKQLH